MSPAKTVIIICGPTAVGKTAFAIAVAKALETEIISADSRQCFRELSIGVAKPSLQELAEVPHWFVNSHSVHEEVNAGVFEQYALQAAATIFATRNLAVIAGGTGLYIKAFCEGMDEVPVVDIDIRQRVITDFHKNGLEFLQNEIQQKDPAFWRVGEQQNPQRLMRALEVFLSTGKSITTFRRGIKKHRSFNIIKIGLELPRAQLNEQINTRVDKMMAEGLLDEVTGLYESRFLNALQTVGYKELFEYLEKKEDLEKAIEKIKINTRQYAKRQMTWFKKDEAVQWYNQRLANVNELLNTLKL